ncbi:MAG: hypothetical protein KAR21_23665 [Spirochaetales bacterium]|nr:hypothetical protein [Spirochaetales bacterium]
MTKYRLLILFFLIISQIMVFGNPNIDESTAGYSINWKDQQLEIVITSTFFDMTKPLPSIKFNTEKNIEKRLNYILLNGIELLTIDSRTRGEDFIKMHPSVIDSIFDIVPSMIKEHSLFTPDLKSLDTKYTLDIYPDIAALFIPHSRTSTVTPTLDFISSADFSGIVIYVDNMLPLYGKQNTGSFSPSLFPRIFDEELNLVIGPLMVDPEIIKITGTVGYQGLSDTIDLVRIGHNPIKVKARGIFGINNTDLIISTREADKILSRQNNIDLIRQGKILIIYDQID